MTEPAAKRQRVDKPMQQQGKKRFKIAKAKKVKPGGVEEVLRFDIIELLGKDLVDRSEGEKLSPKFEHLSQVEVDIVALSSHGDGLGVTSEKDWVIVVPFCLPGERVLTRIYRNEHLHSFGDLVSTLSLSSSSQYTRDDSLVRCKYFGSCSGCQYQMLPYAQQLLHKESVVSKAFANFSSLPSSSIPDALPTLPSPNQYHYRTKLTPHFDPGNAKKFSLEERKESLCIGFESKGKKKVMDIEECPISTLTINEEMSVQRAKVKENLHTYKRGATLLLRHSLPPKDQVSDKSEEEANKPICVTVHKDIVRERVAGLDFEFNAGSFFQNNNGILESLVSYVSNALDQSTETDQYLVDTYCGSGLFAIALASRFTEVSGVEISVDSVKYAKHNAELNGIKNCAFIAGMAEAIFDEIKYPPAQTTILIDPPRKGCDDLFLSQLMRFGPARVIYVSCNVHTQARDVGVLVRDGGFKIESLLPADLFPQTYHVESVCILTKVGEARSQVEQAAAVTSVEEDHEEIPEALTVE